VLIGSSCLVVISKVQRDSRGKGGTTCVRLSWNGENKSCAIAQGEGREGLTVDHFEFPVYYRDFVLLGYGNTSGWEWVKRTDKVLQASMVLYI
jgi:hypothetical protein